MEIPAPIIKADEESPGANAGAATALPKVPKTTGEKWFDGLRFATGEVFILGLTAGIAYLAKYGERKTPEGIKPGRIRELNNWMTEGALNWLAPMQEGKRDQFRARLVENIVGTTLLMHGGNLFVPVMKKMQEKKPEIVASFNRHLGKPGEVEKGNERLAHQTPENWSDIIKGRLVSWGAIFGSFFAVDTIATRTLATEEGSEKIYLLDKAKDKLGRLFAGISKEGHEIAKTPLAQELTSQQFENKTYRFGKILALDIFATTAALTIWSFISKASAMMRGEKKDEIHETAVDEANRIRAEEIAPASPAKSHVAALKERPADFRALAAQQSVASGPALS